LLFFVLLLLKRSLFFYEAFVLGILMQGAWTRSRLKPVAPELALVIGLILGSQSAGLAKRYGLDFLPGGLQPGNPWV
jgi:hypothetical protein